MCACISHYDWPQDPLMCPSFSTTSTAEIGSRASCYGDPACPPLNSEQDLAGAKAQTTNLITQPQQKSIKAKVRARLSWTLIEGFASAGCFSSIFPIYVFGDGASWGHCLIGFGFVCMLGPLCSDLGRAWPFGTQHALLALQSVVEVTPLHCRLQLPVWGGRVVPGMRARA